MSKYDDLLNEAKANAEAFALTAKEYIPKMYSALREEDPNISPYDAKDRIQGLVKPRMQRSKKQAD
jgi:hypothetical protein